MKPFAKPLPAMKYSPKCYWFFFDQSRYCGTLPNNIAMYFEKGPCIKSGNRCWCCAGMFKLEITVFCRVSIAMSRFWTSVESPRCKSHILIGLTPQMLSQHKFIGASLTRFFRPCALLAKFRSDFLKPFRNHGWVERLSWAIRWCHQTRPGHPGLLQKSSRFLRF